MGNVMASCVDSGNDLLYLRRCAAEVQSDKDFQLKVYDEPNNTPSISCDNNVRVLACEEAIRYIW